MPVCDCPIYGEKSHLHLHDETSFGVVDSGADDVYLPVLSFAGQLGDNRRAPQVFTGLNEDVDMVHGPTFPTNQISCPLYGWRISPATTSLAEYLLDWALSPFSEYCNLPSKQVQWAEGPDEANKLYSGMTVNGWTLAGTDDANAAITLQLDLAGKDEANLATAATIPDPMPKLSEFQFSKSQFLIGAGSGSLSEQPLKQFQWQGSRGITPAYLGLDRPRHLRTSKPTSTLSVAIEKCDDTWDVARRSKSPIKKYGRLILKGLHEGTGTSGTNYAVLTINFPQLALTAVGDTYNRNGVNSQNISFAVQKPPAAATESFAYAFTEEA